MKDFNFTNISQDLSYYNYSDYISEEYDYYEDNIYSNNTFKEDDYYDYEDKVFFIIDVVTGIIIAIGLPLTLLAIYALFSLVRGGHVAPIYVINLLISDLIQLCSLIIYVVNPEDEKIWRGGAVAYWSSLVASVGFMVCVALERYLVIACPLWYRFRRTVKIPVMVCVLVWLLCLVYLLLSVFFTNYMVWAIIRGIFFLLPLPLFIFFLVGTLRALSASRVPSDEKRRIVGVLVLVLLIYTLLFLPTIIYCLAVENFHLSSLSFIFLKLSPLADLLLYVFMKRGIVDKLLASVCCCRVDSNDSSRVESNDINTSTV